MQDSRVANEDDADTTAADSDDDSLSGVDNNDSTSPQRALHEISIMSDREVESVALLREIFPDESEQELKNLHRNRLLHSAAKKLPFSSKLGQRIWNLVQEEYNHVEPPEVTLPDDFLRLPSRRDDGTDQTADQWQKQLLQQFEQRVLRQHREYQETMGGEVAYPLDEEFCYTRAVSRDVAVGLGMTLCEESGCIWVHSIHGRNGVRWFRAPPDTESGGPAIREGIHPGDWVLGIQGEALLPMTNHKQFLRHAVSSVQAADNPVVLHLQRVPFNGMHPLAGTGPSLLDTTMEPVDISYSEESVSIATPNSRSSGTATRTHPFIEAMASKGLIQNKKEELKASKALLQYTERARHWESASSFRIDANTFELRPHFDPSEVAFPSNDNSLPFVGGDGDSVPSYAPSTPTLDPTVDSVPIEYVGGGLSEQEGLLGFQLDDQFQAAASPQRKMRASFPGQRVEKSLPQSSDVFIPLMGVRKALCARIVNTFLDDQRRAYTIWVYDVESGREWYAPVRYLSDFQELRSATGPLCRSIYQIPFPSSGWLAFGVHEKSEPDSVRDAKCRQLETFLRRLCTHLYTDSLHPNIAEIAIHVQSFLGCDVGLSPGNGSFLYLQNYSLNNEPMWGQRLEEAHTVVQMNVRLLLKRSIQRYTYRLFLLHAMKRVVDDFVTKTRENGPTLKEIEALGAQGRDVLKARAMRDLGRIQGFLDQIQDLVLEGCAADFESIARRRDFVALRDFMNGKAGDAYLNKTVREAVREQIEIEIYVPLRCVVSRLLVNGWRHDDMEIHFKMKVSSRRLWSCSCCLASTCR